MDRSAGGRSPSTLLDNRATLAHDRLYRLGCVVRARSGHVQAVIPFKQGWSLKPLQVVFMLLGEQRAPRASVGAACSKVNVQIRRKEQKSAPPRF
jgi:hypothetical protein